MCFSSSAHFLAIFSPDLMSRSLRNEVTLIFDTLLSLPSCSCSKSDTSSSSVVWWWCCKHFRGAETIQMCLTEIDHKTTNKTYIIVRRLFAPSFVELVAHVERLVAATGGLKEVVFGDHVVYLVMRLYFKCYFGRPRPIEFVQWLGNTFISKG